VRGRPLTYAVGARSRCSDESERATRGSARIEP